jgi:hypothetical protein
VRNRGRGAPGIEYGSATDLHARIADLPRSPLDR